MIKKIKRVLGLLLILIIMGQGMQSDQIHAQDDVVDPPVFYVDSTNPEAMDDAQGGSIEQPWQTIGYALQQLRPGDTLYIRGGTHLVDKTNLSEANSGHQDAPITVTAFPDEDVILQSSGPIYLLGTSWWLFEGLVFENFMHHVFELGSHQTLEQSNTTQASHIILRQNEFRAGTRTVVEVNNAQNILIENNHFHNIRTGEPFYDETGEKAGVEAKAINIRYQAENIVVQNNRFEDIGADGVHLGSKFWRDGASIQGIQILDNSFWINRPHESEFDNIGRQAIGIETGQDVLISGNKIEGYRPTTPDQDTRAGFGIGLNIAGEVQDFIIEKNIFENNTRHLKITGSSSEYKGIAQNIEISNNILRQAQRSGTIAGLALTVEDTEQINILHNVFSENDYFLRSQTMQGGVFNNNVILDGEADITERSSQWTSAANGWQISNIPNVLQSESDVIADALGLNEAFYPLADSPLINRGVPADMEEDIAGQLRDDLPDIGIFESAWLRITPDITEIEEDDSLDIQLEVVAAHNLATIDVQCTVDPTALIWQEVTPGAIYETPNFAEYNLDAQTGLWTARLTEENGMISGEGDLAILRFIGNLGTTDIACQASGTSIEGEPLSISSHTSTPILVQPRLPGSIAGIVEYEGPAPMLGGQISATGRITSEMELVADQFHLTTLPVGEYQLKVQAPQYLPNCLTTTIDRGEDKVVPPTTLQIGDLNDDEVIDITDLTLISGNIGLGSADMDPRADLNQDGTVDVRDLALLASNYGKSGCQPWEPTEEDEGVQHVSASPAPTNQAGTIELASLTKGLVGYWPLNESGQTRRDASGQGNHLSVENNGIQSGPGPVDEATTFDFDGKGYLSISDSAQEGLDVKNSLTVAGWVKMDKPWLRQGLVSKYKSGGGNRAYDLYFSSHNRLRWVVSPDGTYRSSYALSAYTDDDLEPGVWYHVAAVFDANAKKLRVYLDGEQVASKSVNYTTINNSSAPFILGADQYLGQTDRYFDGAMDDWRVYNRALGKTELQQLINLGNAPEPEVVAGPPTPPARAPLSCNPTGGSGGRGPGIYETKIQGLNVQLVVGDGYDPDTPTKLAFFLHGDGGRYVRFDKSDPVNQLVNEQDWILVSPQSPNGGEAWWTNWNGNHVTKLANLFDEMFQKYNVCRDIVYGSGGSGGPEFWTAQFFPRRGGQYPAHMVMGCGGGQASGASAIRDKLVELGQDFDTVNNSTFDFVYGTHDYLYASIRGSVGLYRHAGFHVREEVMKRAGHCNEWPGDGFPNLTDKIAEHWSQLIVELEQVDGSGSILAGCDHTIGPKIDIANGWQNYDGVDPGDVVCVRGGNRNALTLQNFQGTATKPITFINFDGAVTIDSDKWYGIRIRNSQHIRLTGIGSADETYGFKIIGSTSHGVRIGERSSHFEIDHIEVTNVPLTGMAAQTKGTCSDGSENEIDYDRDGKIEDDRDDAVNRDNFVQRNSIFHHNYIHNVGTEGLYVGSSFHGREQTSRCNNGDETRFDPVLHGVHIYQNIVTDTGWDGIQVGSAVEDCVIHHNKIYRDSRANESSQQSGIMNNPGSVCEIHSNLIKDGARRGIFISGSAGNEVHNNVIVNAGQLEKDSAIIVAQDGRTGPLSIYNNTIVNPAQYGIAYRSERAHPDVIKRNIVVNPDSNLAVQTKGQEHISVNNNYIAPNLNALKVKDASQDDYRLTDNSPALGLGADLDPSFSDLEDPNYSHDPFDPENTTDPSDDSEGEAEEENPSDEQDEVELPQGPYLEVRPAETGVQSGDNLDLELIVTNVEQLYGMQMVCQWDPAQLTWQASSWGDFFTDYLVGVDQALPNQWMGIITQKFPAQPLNGTGTSVTLTAQVTANPGSVEISCEVLAVTETGQILPMAVVSQPILVSEALINDNDVTTALSDDLDFNIQTTAMASTQPPLEVEIEAAVASTNEGSFEAESESNVDAATVAEVFPTEASPISEESHVEAEGVIDDKPEVTTKAVPQIATAEEQLDGPTIVEEIVTVEPEMGIAHYLPGDETEESITTVVEVPVAAEQPTSEISVASDEAVIGALSPAKPAQPYQTLESQNNFFPWLGLVLLMSAVLLLAILGLFVQFGLWSGWYWLHRLRRR